MHVFTWSKIKILQYLAEDIGDLAKYLKTKTVTDTVQSLSLSVSYT